jgi:hypothetical protein
VRSKSNRIWFAVALAVIVGVLGPLFVPPDHRREFNFAMVGLIGVLLVVILTTLSGGQIAAVAAATPAGEEVLKQGRASLLLEPKTFFSAAQGGVLTLTPTKVVFASHGVLQKAAVHAWALSDLRRIEDARTMGVASSLRLHFKDARCVVAVTDRDTWRTALEGAAGLTPASPGSDPKPGDQ